MVSRSILTKRRLLGVVLLCAVLMGGLTIWSQTGNVAEAAIVNPHPGLVGWWRFDEGVGTVATDSSGYGNNGTINGASWAAGKYGQALSFDGINDYVAISDDASSHFGIGSFSLKCWIKISSTNNNNERIIYTYNPDNQKGFMLFHDAGVIKLVTWNPYAMIASSAITPDLWYQVVFVRNVSAANKFQIYINAEMPTEETGHSSDVTTGKTYYVGCDYGLGFNLAGQLDEVCIFNGALSAAEIQESYQKGPNFSSRLLAKVPKGTTQFITTLSWQGSGSMNVTIQSPSKTYTEDDSSVSTYAKTSYSSASSGMLNIKRVAVTMTAPSSDENWYITLIHNNVQDYKITVEAQK